MAALTSWEHRLAWLSTATGLARVKFGVEHGQLLCQLAVRDEAAGCVVGLQHLRSSKNHSLRACIRVRVRVGVRVQF